MARMIDQIRASKLPSNMMQFAARGALAVSPAENIEILVYLAKHNKVFGELARMTLAGWDEKASLQAASDPKTLLEVLEYMISPDNLRPKLLPALLENSSVPEKALTQFAVSASRESIEMMLRSQRVRSLSGVLQSLAANPYLKANEIAEVMSLLQAGATAHESSGGDSPVGAENSGELKSDPAAVASASDPAAASSEEHADAPDEAVSSYLAEHASEIEAEKDKPFQAIGGIVELLGADYFPVHEAEKAPEAGSPAVPVESSSPSSSAQPAAGAKPSLAAKHAGSHAEPKRENTLQKINSLDVKGRIQLALKGNKEERSILIRDGTKVVALAVLEAPKLSDGEVEKFASQKNVLEAVLRQIPLKRRFVKNYIVVRNLVANPRTPLDLGLGLMKNLLTQDLKNLSANKEVSETIRKLALKMYKQKLEAANKK
jgi:hypothetical protein